MPCKAHIFLYKVACLPILAGGLVFLATDVAAQGMEEQKVYVQDQHPLAADAAKEAAADYPKAGDHVKEDILNNKGKARQVYGAAEDHPAATKKLYEDAQKHPAAAKKVYGAATEAPWKTKKAYHRADKNPEAAGKLYHKGKNNTAAAVDEYQKRMD